MPLPRTLLLFIFLLLCSRQEVYAQNFRKGNHLLSAGYGLGTAYQASALTYGFTVRDLDSSTTAGHILGPMYFKYEYGLSQWIGLSISYAWLNSNTEVTYIAPKDSAPCNAKIRYSTFSLLGRMNLHFAPSSKYFDPYVGLGAGIRNYHFEMSSDERNFKKRSETYYSPGFEITFGVRGYIIPSLAIYAEIGAAKSFLQGGLTYKF
jgi:hypothetical protein